MSDLAGSSLRPALARDCEIIVVDDGSQDSTLLEVASFAPQAKLAGIPVRVFSSATHNIARQRNVAIAHARHAYVVFIDADCEAPPGWLNQISAALDREDSKVVGLGGGQHPPRQRSRAPMFHQALDLFLNAAWTGIGASQLRRAKRRENVDHLATCNAVFRRTALLEIGLFDPTFARVGEDVDLGWRLRRHGGEVAAHGWP